MRLNLVALLAGSLVAASALAQATREPANIRWDWTGVIGTGQSLAVGQNASRVASTTQPFNNLQLDTADLAWPIDPADARLALVPLVEPIGRLAEHGGGWPVNMAGESPQAAMANQLTAMARERFDRDLISVHANVAENGQGLRVIEKGATTRDTNGRAYEASLVATRAIARLAKDQDKTFGVGAILLTHGETDFRSDDYELGVRKLWENYNSDLAAITGQTEKVLMILSQQHGLGNPAVSTVAQWKLGVDYPDEIICSGPKYQYESADGLHLTTDGYRQLGEKYAQVYFERAILGRRWLPLEPTGVTRDGRTLTVAFHVPVGPLAWDETMDPPHAGVAEWKNGKGFEVATADGTRVAIDGVEIRGDAVVIACGGDPGADAVVSYALTGEARRAKPSPGFARWGLLRDSDPFRGRVTGRPQPNYALAFRMTAR